MRTKINLQQWLDAARSQLTPSVETPAIIAQALLANELGQPRTWLLAHPEYSLSADVLQHLNSHLERILEGEPLPYVTGRQEFYGLDFYVNHASLIPRPETELLVEEALTWLDSGPPSHRQALDVGTGSGCIAICLANFSYDLKIIATDLSTAALHVARTNCFLNEVEREIQLIQMDLVTGLSAQFDLICANLPYIPTQTLAGLQVSRFEPRLALDGGADGLVYIRQLLSDARFILAQGGVMLLEIESGQGQSAAELARQFFPHADIMVKNDLASLPRLLRVENKIP